MNFNHEERIAKPKSFLNLWPHVGGDQWTKTSLIFFNSEIASSLIQDRIPVNGLGNGYEPRYYWRFTTVIAAPKRGDGNHMERTWKLVLIRVWAIMVNFTSNKYRYIWERILRNECGDRNLSRSNSCNRLNLGMFTFRALTAESWLIGYFVLFSVTLSWLVN